jgi:hypothetical protein
MNLPTIKIITNEFNLRQEDVSKIVYSDIEQAIYTFREEIRLAENVETLEFIRRYLWDNLFAEKGAYYELCKRSPMLKILRLNASKRYFDLLFEKEHKEFNEISYEIVAPPIKVRTIVITNSQSDSIEINGELTEEDIQPL